MKKGNKNKYINPFLDFSIPIIKPNIANRELVIKLGTIPECLQGSTDAASRTPNNAPDLNAGGNRLLIMIASTNCKTTSIEFKIAKVYTKFTDVRILILR